MTTYRPNRNLVRRELDGRMVNVARVRGHVFVCAEACCCGRVDLTNAPVPDYHAEWTRRRLRNFVHLTVGGCLGPCALANVAMLLFDGEPTWFHSMNDAPAVAALFDYLETRLEGGDPTLPSALAAKAFSGYQWQARPDGALVEDQREWRGPGARPDQAPACELDPADLQVAALAHDAPALPVLEGVVAAPRANGEPVFAEPWQSRAFGMAVAAAQGDDWDAFRERLIEEIAAAEAAGDPFDYYANWLRAFEGFLEERGVVAPGELAERTAEFEFGERQEVF